MDIKDILDKKGILEEKNAEKTKVLEVKSLKGIGDGKVTIRSITDEEYDAIERSSKSDYEMNKNAVYRAVVKPDLKDKTLQDGLGCKANPLDVVRKIFSRAEVNKISDEIAKLSNMVQEKDLIKEIKNS